MIYADLAGAYQYFVNKALPDLSIFRTLWRLNPNLFTHGYNTAKNERLPDFALYANATEVQDETFQFPDGSYVTKYDFANYVRERDFVGVYGEKTGSWYIHASNEYQPGNHLSQTLTVGCARLPRRSFSRRSMLMDGCRCTGNPPQAMLFNSTSCRIPRTSASGRRHRSLWVRSGDLGYGIWYLQPSLTPPLSPTLTPVKNNGSLSDTRSRAAKERLAFPYAFLNNTAYHSRGSIKGKLSISDGRPAAGAAIFLGDTDTSIRPLVQGSGYYYTTFAAADGSFSLDNVRSGTYGLIAASNGGVIGDVYTNLTTSVTISKGETTDAQVLTWPIPANRKNIFQIGSFDKKATGFENSGPRQHGLTDHSPANLTYTIGTSTPSDWYYASSQLGTWSIVFNTTAPAQAKQAVLSVSLAGYSQSASLTIHLNDNKTIGTISKDTITSDPALYRSGTVSGEWRFLQYDIAISELKDGENVLSFLTERYTRWRGVMWDSIVLEWVL